MTKEIPGEFADLKPYVQDWALATHNERYAKRASVTAKDLKAFYEAMLPHLEKILDKADDYPLGKMPEDMEQVFFMALSMAEIAPHVELYGGDPAVPHSFEEARMIAVEGNQRG